MKKDDRINQIAEKTLELINKKGSVDALRTKDLADAIGASEATIFKFFESKEVILNTVIRRYIHRKPIKIQASDLKTPDDFENFLREILDTSLDLSPSRAPYVSLLIQISLKENPITINKKTTSTPFSKEQEDEIEKLKYSLDKGWITQIKYDDLFQKIFTDN